MAEGRSSPPTVTVVTIFKDAEPYLEEAIRSVLAQSHESFELLLVDDGSGDGSGTIARAWADRDRRVQVLQHPGGENRGMSASRNLGIEKARGSLLAFLDGDDVWLPGRLERHVRALEEHPSAAMVFGPTRLWFSWAEGAPVGEERDPLRRTGVAPGRPIPPPELLVGALRSEVKTPATCSMTLRTAAVRALGGFEESFRGMYEDQVFFAKLWLREPCVAVDECLDLYRQHPRSACYVARYEGRYYGSVANHEHLAFLRWLQGHAAEHPGAGDALREALRWWLERYRHPWRARLADWWRDPRWQTKAALRSAARTVLPDRAYRWVWSRWQGFTRAHEQPGREARRVGDPRSE